MVLDATELYAVKSLVCGYLDHGEQLAKHVLYLCELRVPPSLEIALTSLSVFIPAVKNFLSVDFLSRDDVNCFTGKSNRDKKKSTLKISPKSTLRECLFFYRHTVWLNTSDIATHHTIMDSLLKVLEVPVLTLFNNV